MLEQQDTISSGAVGLDNILNGGLSPNRLYLVEGLPGSGKTTLALQFLLEGLKNGESVLYVTLSETAEELRAVAASHGWSLEGMHIHEVIASEDLLDPAQQYTLFHPSEIELGDTTQGILSCVEQLHPARVVIDSLSELKLLAGDPLRYRRQVLAYKQFFARRSCTVLLLDDQPQSNEMQVRSIAHGVISLAQAGRDYGSDRRRLRIMKYRGVAFRDGFHDYTIRHGGLVVYPRLIAAESRELVDRQQISSDIAGLDSLLGGGLEEGTSTIIGGPPGTGKSTLAAQFVSAALHRGEKAAFFVFEESANMLVNRTEALGIDFRSPLASGQLTIQQVDPAELSPGEFTQAVCKAVEKGNAKVVVLDSLNGYLNAMPDERFLAMHMHELLTYLGQRGVITIIVGVHQGMIGNAMNSAIDASYLADNVILLRYFEFRGEVRLAISVFKKRGSRHERTIREFSISKGIHVGDPLRDFHGVLTGVPRFTGDALNDSE
jgi:circadian clock protein KaiC